FTGPWTSTDVGRDAPATSVPPRTAIGVTVIAIGPSASGATVSTLPVAGPRVTTGRPPTSTTTPTAPAVSQRIAMVSPGRASCGLASTNTTTGAPPSKRLRP